MLIRRCPGPCPLVDLGSLNPPAQCVRRDTELLPNPRTHPASATGVVSRIKHKTNRTPAKLFRIFTLYCHWSSSTFGESRTSIKPGAIHFHWPLLDKGTNHVYIKPATPRLNGRVERSHRIDSEEFYRLLEGQVIHDVNLFNDKLQEWDDYYHYDRPHGVLAGSTPANASNRKPKTLCHRPPSVAHIMRQHRHFGSEALSNTRRCGLTNLKDELEAISTLEAGQAALIAGSYVEARLKFERSRDLYLNIGDLRMAALCFHNLGMVFAQLGDFPESERAYLRARGQYVALDQFDKVAALDEKLGSGYLQAGRLDESANSYLLARAHFSDQNVLEKVAICDRELARAYFEAGCDDDSVAHLLARREYLVTERLSDEVAEADLTLGKLHTSAGRWDEAEARLQASREHYEMHKHSPFGVAACDRALGDLFRRRDNTVEAERRYLAARSVYADHGGFDMQVKNIDAIIAALRE